jgi:hypothetical protein
LALRQHAASVGRQRREQAVFDGREVHFRPGAAHQARGAVHFHVAKAEQRLRFFAAGCRARAAQVGAHARQQLAGAEGFGQVVVGPGVERGDLVGLARARREHDDRHARPAAYVADQRNAVAVGQAQVEHQQVGLARAHRRQAVAQRGRLVHLPAFGL